VSKRQEWNILGSQEVNKSNAFRAVWMKADVHSLPVIESPTIVNVRLSKR
jgi:hypothetical protein